MSRTWMRGARLLSSFSRCRKLIIHTINYSPSFRSTTIFTNHLHPSHSQRRLFNSSTSSPSLKPSSNKLFVGGLSWSVDEKSLKDAFSSFGEVTEVRIVYDKDSGRARGFGFVIFSNEDDAKSAKDAMDGKALLGRPLRINFALEKARGVPVVVPRFSDIRNLNRR
ncbi:glycine-rich RNA-binding protein 4, mitochondrial [Vicia villosa]|uniref:glycine-rich RNA-binding protein 4, mitochondrial n=1 Tax=Vicia villosa TaxID=3911 RepID=UPI00273C2C25|nr:glycine-rich RNA-binding protein 4, mitochondrial [Vicia villosa]